MQEGPFVWENVGASVGCLSAGRPPRWIYGALGALALGFVAVVVAGIVSS